MAPLTTGAGIDAEFGERVAKQIRESLEDFGVLEPLEPRVVENTEKMFRMQAGVASLTPIQWRQIAGQLGADLLVIASGDTSGSGVEVKATLVEPWWGDELRIPEITVPNDEGSEAKEAGRRVAEGLAEQLAHLEALWQCSEHLRAGRFGDALASCDEVIELRQDWMQAFYARGRALMGLQEWEEAVPDLKRALSAGPRLAVTAAARVIQALAYTSMRLGDADGAAALYRQYLALMPEDANERLSIADTLHAAGHVDAAEAIVEEGLALDPTNQRLSAYLENPAAHVRTPADSASGSTCDVWTLEVKNLELVDVEAYLYRGSKVVPVRQAEARGAGAHGGLLRVIRANGQEMLTLSGVNPIVMFYEYQPYRPAEREPRLDANGRTFFVTIAPAQPESRTLFSLASPLKVEPHGMRRLDLRFTCEEQD